LKGKLTPCSNLLTGSSDTNNNRLAPTLVASLESAAHNMNVTSAIESVVTATISHLNKLLLDRLTLELRRINKVGSAELLSPRLLALIDIDGDDLASLVLHGTLDDRKTDATGTEHSDVGALLNTAAAGSDDGGTVTRCDTAAEQAGPIHGGVGGDGYDRDVGDDGVLAEGRGTHEVQERLATAGEARGTVWQDATALGCANLAAEVGLAGLAELAFAALGGAMCRLVTWSKGIDIRAWEVAY